MSITAKGYQSEPLSAKLEEQIQARLVFLRAELRLARDEVTRLEDAPIGSGLPKAVVKLSRLEGNIGSLEWVLREVEVIKLNLI